MKILTVLTLFLFLSSCQKKKEIFITNNNTKTLHVKIPENILELSNKKLLNKFSNKKVEYIALETRPESVIGDIDKIIIIDNDFYLLDKKNTKGIFIFNEKGKYLRKIQNVGNGPGEYLRISDFQYNRATKQLEIYDDITFKIYIYNLNGTFIRSVNSFNFDNFLPVGKEDRFFYLKFFPDRKAIKDNYRLVKMNEKGDISHLSFKYDDKNKRQRITGLLNHFYVNESVLNMTNILFYEQYDRNIYEVSDEIINIKYTIDFINHNSPLKFIDSDVKNKEVYIYDNKLPYLFEIVYENEERIIFNYVVGRVILQINYNKLEDTYKQYKCHYSIEDKLHIAASSYLGESYDISIMEPKAFLINGCYKKHQSLKNITNTDNPVLIKIYDEK